MSDCTVNNAEITHSTFQRLEDNKYVKDIILPLTLTSIGYSAFSSSPSLINVIIPVCVAGIGLEAFANCAGLASVTFEGNSTVIELGASDTFQSDRSLSSEGGR